MHECNSQKRKEELYGLFKEAVLSKLRVLPTIAALAATLLVVATFNDNLFPLTKFVRFLLSILLLVIPVSLYFYLDENNEVANKAQTALKQETGSAFSLPHKNFWKLIQVHFSYIALAIILFFTVAVVYLIWKYSVPISKPFTL